MQNPLPLLPVNAAVHSGDSGTRDKLGFVTPRQYLKSGRHDGHIRDTMRTDRVPDERGSFIRGVEQVAVLRPERARTPPDLRLMSLLLISIVSIQL